MSRTRALGALALVLAAVGVLARWAWPSARPALDCPPEAVRRVRAGDGWVAACADGGEPLPAGARLALGGRLDLNAATAEELALLPGVGPSLARRLVEARDAHGGFRDWADVDAVSGVGRATLRVLQEVAELGGPGPGAPCVVSQPPCRSPVPSAP